MEISGDEKTPVFVLSEVFSLLGKLPPDICPNVALMGDNEFIFSYKGKIHYSYYRTGSDPVSGIKQDRGEVISLFAQLEIVVNQVIVVHLNQRGVEPVSKLENMLDEISFHAKIKLLSDWSLIDKQTKQILYEVKQVRNALAHEWGIEGIMYKNGLIFDREDDSSFKKFKKDIRGIFVILFDLYNGEILTPETLINKVRALAVSSKV